MKGTLIVTAIAMLIHGQAQASDSYELRKSKRWNSHECRFWWDQGRSNPEVQKEAMKMQSCIEPVAAPASEEKLAVAPAGEVTSESTNAKSIAELLDETRKKMAATSSVENQKAAEIMKMLSP